MKTEYIQDVGVDDLPSDPRYSLFAADKPDTCFIGENCHCSVWWKQTPEHEKRLGVIGHYHAESSNDSKVLLDTACNYLKSKGCEVAVGPMNGNTWKAYRFVSWSDGSEPFIMEPQNPMEWPVFWQEAGFSPYQEYESSVNSVLHRSDSRLDKARERLKGSGISWRSIDPSNFSSELLKVYRLSLLAFKDNILYSPLEKDVFLNLYLPYADKIDSRYVMIAEDSKAECCGFLFALPDLLQLQYQARIDRLIIKTLAVHPSRQNGGLGSVLVEQVQRRAADDGLSPAVHALMHSANKSVNIGRANTLMRKYTLYSRNLT